MNLRGTLIRFILMNLLFIKNIGVCILAFLSITCSNATNAQNLDSLNQEQLQQRIPEWAKKVVENSEIMKSYEILDEINPFYLEADFNADELVDIVFYVKGKLSQKNGVAIINRGDNNVYILGAGKDIGMGTDISWCNTWFVYRDKWIYNFNDKKKKFMIRNPGIEIVKSEKTSVVLYWDKRSYKSYVKHI